MSSQSGYDRQKGVAGSPPVFLPSKTGSSTAAAAAPPPGLGRSSPPPKGYNGSGPSELRRPPPSAYKSGRPPPLRPLPSPPRSDRMSSGRASWEQSSRIMPRKHLTPPPGAVSPLRPALRRRPSMGSEKSPSPQHSPPPSPQHRSWQPPPAARQRSWSQHHGAAGSGPRPSPQRRGAELKSFDANDRAPEDRIAAAPRVAANQPWMPFGTYEHVVRGSLLIDGVNYAKFEQAKGDDVSSLKAFFDALADDLIAEVGNGVRRENVLFRAFPGAIKTVTLHYGDDGRSGRRPAPSDPRLVDAEWNLNVEYAVRAIDAQRQHNIAVGMYTSLTSPQGFAGERCRAVYANLIDPHSVDSRRIVITSPDTAPGPQQPLQLQQPAPRTASPPPGSPSVPRPEPPFEPIIGGHKSFSLENELRERNLHASANAAAAQGSWYQGPQGWPAPGSGSPRRDFVSQQGRALSPGWGAQVVPLSPPPPPRVCPPPPSEGALPPCTFHLTELEMRDKELAQLGEKIFRERLALRHTAEAARTPAASPCVTVPLAPAHRLTPCITPSAHLVATEF